MSRPEHIELWYAIRVQRKLANIAAASIRKKGYEEFLPVCRVRRRWSDRFKELTVPLFPGYLFCRFSVNDCLMPILTTPGVIGIVGAGKTPLSVDEREIAAVKAVVRSGLATRPWPFVEVGAVVSIERGPLAGMNGVVVNTDKLYRLVISITLLRRSVAVEVNRDWVRPVARTSATAAHSPAGDDARP